jgi:hypothetical protein
LINNSYKLLVVDVDGTLLGRDGNISTENKEAIAQACSLGIKVSLSTGRTLQSGLKVINQLPLDGYHIFFDGALVTDPEQNKEVYIQLISKRLVREAVEFAHVNEINLELFSATQYFIERETWASDIRRQYFGILPALTDFTNIWERERIIKGTVAVSSAEERAKADSLCRRFEGDLDNLTFSWTSTPAYPNVDFVNIVARGVSKGRALEALTSYLAIPLAEVIAIGDERNDVSLLATAGLAIAMGNAVAEVKAVADYITLDVDQSGVAAAIKKFLL